MWRIGGALGAMLLWSGAAMAEMPAPVPASGWRASLERAAAAIPMPEMPRRLVAEARLEPRIEALTGWVASASLDAAASLEARGEALAMAAARIAWNDPRLSLHWHAELAPRRPVLAELAALHLRMDWRAALGGFELASEAGGLVWAAVPGGAWVARRVGGAE
jgi:hypothetical protein